VNVAGAILGVVVTVKALLGTCVNRGSDSDIVSPTLRSAFNENVSATVVVAIGTRGAKDTIEPEKNPTGLDFTTVRKSKATGAPLLDRAPHLTVESCERLIPVAGSSKPSTVNVLAALGLRSTLNFIFKTLVVWSQLTEPSKTFPRSFNARAPEFLVNSGSSHWIISPAVKPIVLESCMVASIDAAPPAAVFVGAPEIIVSALTVCGKLTE
jgi:hypothetical protein